ncbi:MAG: CRISPR-associated endonuclease Cas2 [Planctomycetota bacterium]|nr:MAG: CRISPR-associated endonuclease Cas2 [Planctomycetota bacterium]
MTSHHLVLCYDVVDDRARRRLHRALKGFLRPVQKSVFEGPLPGRRLPALEFAVRRHMNPEEDTVRIYRLCVACRAQTALLGLSPRVEGPPLCRVI